MFTLDRSDVLIRLNSSQADRLLNSWEISGSRGVGNQNLWEGHNYFSFIDLSSQDWVKAVRK